MREGLTVGEIAQRLGAPAPEQIRYWGKLGLLEKLEGPRGTGHHQRYTERSVFLAAVLDRIAWWGDVAFMVRRWRLRRALEQAYGRLARLPETRALFLVMAVTGRGHVTAVVEADARTREIELPPKIEVQLMMVYDLSRIYRRCQDVACAL